MSNVCFIFARIRERSVSQRPNAIKSESNAKPQAVTRKAHSPGRRLHATNHKPGKNIAIKCFKMRSVRSFLADERLLGLLGQIFAGSERSKRDESLWTAWRGECRDATRWLANSKNALGAVPLSSLSNDDHSLHSVAV